jgi:hypothetical protein
MALARPFSPFSTSRRRRGAVLLILAATPGCWIVAGLEDRPLAASSSATADGAPAEGGGSDSPAGGDGPVVGPADAGIDARVDASTDAAAPIRLKATLNGAKVVPTTGSESTGTGEALFTYYPDTAKLCGVVVYAFAATPTEAHIHQGTATETGQVVFTFPAAPNYTVAQTVPSSLLAQFQSQTLYVDIHSDVRPAGEIRGSIGLDTNGAALQPCP